MYTRCNAKPFTPKINILYFLCELLQYSLGSQKPNYERREQMIHLGYSSLLPLCAHSNIHTLLRYVGSCAEQF